MKRFTGVLCAVSFLAFAVSAGAQGADPGLEKLRRSYEQAWARGDAAAVAAHYAENALSVNADGVQQGRAAVQAMLAKNFAGPWKGATLVVRLGKSQPLGPDTVLHEGTYEVQGLKAPDGKPLSIKGSYLNTLVKKGGDYLIAGHMAFAPPPTGAAPAAK
jgi:uncharacterized protein (TIGR02246 family)